MERLSDKAILQKNDQVKKSVGSARPVEAGSIGDHLLVAPRHCDRFTVHIDDKAGRTAAVELNFVTNRQRRLAPILKTLGASHKLQHPEVK
jgi:hypothetical protein